MAQLAGHYSGLCSGCAYYKLPAEKLYRSNWQLGLLARDGLGMPADVKEMERLFLIASGQGDARAQRALGKAYRNGILLRQNYEKAITFLTLAIVWTGMPNLFEAKCTWQVKAVWQTQRLSIITERQRITAIC